MSSYEAHTSVCLDLALPGVPITTLGAKPADVHVSSAGVPFMLTQTGSVSEDDAYTVTEANAVFDGSFTAPAGAVNAVVMRMFASADKSPIRWLSGYMYFGSRTTFKDFDKVMVFGSGSGKVRVWADKRLVVSGSFTAVGAPDNVRCIRLPRGTKGFGLKVEIVGVVDVRFLEVTYTLEGES